LDNKAQGETEIISALATIAVLFVAVLLFSSLHSHEITFTKEFYRKADFCRETASLIENMNSMYGEQSIEFNSELDFNVTENGIVFEDYSCTYAGSANNSTVLIGTVRAYEENGAVLLENI